MFICTNKRSCIKKVAVFLKQDECIVATVFDTMANVFFVE